VKVRSQQRREQTPFYEELGTILRERTAAGTRVLTSEKPFDSLAFHADRRIVGNLADDDLVPTLASGGPPAAIPDAVFAIVDPPFRAYDRPREELSRYLRDHFEAADLKLARSGRSIALFDLSRPLRSRRDG
jgi:hypothetical protein